jgi:hypothetical protein
LSLQLVDYDRDGRALKGGFLRDLGARYWSALTHVVEHDLAIDVTIVSERATLTFLRSMPRIVLDSVRGKALHSATVLDEEVRGRKVEN